MRKELCEQEVKYDELIRLFLLEAGIYILLLYCMNNWIITDQVIFNSMMGLVDMDSDLDHYFLTIGKGRNWAYLVSPIVFALRVFFTGCVLYSVLLIKNQPAPFPAVLKLMLIAELVFILGSAIRTAWLLVKSDIGTIQEISEAALFSLADLVRVPPDSIYLAGLRVLNLFELTYILILGFLLSVLLKMNWRNGLRYVLGSYGLLLLCWICLICLVQLL